MNRTDCVGISDTRTEHIKHIGDVFIQDGLQMKMKSIKLSINFICI